MLKHTTKAFCILAYSVESQTGLRNMGASDFHRAERKQNSSPDKDSPAFISESLWFLHGHRLLKGHWQRQTQF